MSRRSIVCISRAALLRASVPLLLCLSVAACHRGNDAGKPALQGVPAAAASTPKAIAKHVFGLVSASSVVRDSRIALLLQFNAPLASAQTFDRQIAVTGPNGEVVSGSWSLQSDGRTLSFPFVEANRHYAVLLHAGLLAADGRTLGHEIKHDVYSGNLPSAVGFASHGSVLPARGTRGLPVVSMNVHDADVEFFRVHDDALSDLYCAYPANKHCDTYELYTTGQPVRPRRLLSPGAAWIVRDILAHNPADVEGGPLADAINRHATVAWKTGTSYGYRDAWSIGVTDRWTVGVWIGRPDGTPSPGQYGAVTALPLLFQIVDMLPAGGGRAHAAQPASVSSREICWPLGGAANATPANLCRQRRRAWVLDDALPPSFAERDLGAWTSGLVTVRVNDKGQRLSGACHASHERTTQLARWPALATPWLGVADRASAALPPLAPGCAADSLDAVTPIRIAGLADGVTLRKAPNSDHPLRVTVQALGAQGSVQWLLDGRLQGRSEGAAALTLTLQQPGRHTVTALARRGAFSSLQLRVVD